ncbi:MAG: hypothetical protein HYV09_14785 [Deltaproteobacteria bacterium]|nr:hypothetical protein [Deltaproteobacteria bacterium]
MLLFQKPFHQGLVDGTIRLTFRRWDKPRVRAGGRYRCHPIGVLVVDAIERVRVGDIDDDDARLAGFSSREALLDYMTAYMAGREPVDGATEVFRVALHHGGEADRVEAAFDDALTLEDVKALREKLARMDAREPWTRKTLRLIERHPRVAASRLAAKLGRDTKPFKADVVRLKKLGLTQSFEVGYDLTPRGRAFLAALRKKR